MDNTDDLVKMTVNTLKGLKVTFPSCTKDKEINQSLEVAINAVSNMDTAVREARQTGCTMAKYDDKEIVTKTISEFLDPEPKEDKPTKMDEVLLEVQWYILNRIDASIKKNVDKE